MDQLQLLLTFMETSTLIGEESIPTQQESLGVLTQFLLWGSENHQLMLSTGSQKIHGEIHGGEKHQMVIQSTELTKDTSESRKIQEIVNRYMIRI